MEPSSAQGHPNRVIALKSCRLLLSHFDRRELHPIGATRRAGRPGKDPCDAVFHVHRL